MLKKVGFALAFVVSFALRVQAQDQDAEAIKKAILEKVRAKLTEERKKILERVSKLIDEEFAKDAKKPDPKPDPKPDTKPGADLPAEYAKKIKDLERQLKLLDEKREEIVNDIRKTRNMALDEEIRKEAKDKGPKDEQEFQEFFDEALKDHEAKEFKSSIKKFKMIYYLLPKTPFGATSAYNVACGYALAGDKEQALDWLEICTSAGWSNWDHMRKDTDLDTLRNEKRYKKLLADK